MVEASRPPLSGKISAILLSWRRAYNLPKIVEGLRQSPRIGEILVWNNDPETPLRLSDVVVVNSSQNLSCIARHCLIPAARYETVWFQDDDLLVTARQLEAIYRVYADDPLQIYGAQGRNIVNGLYSADTVYGDCDIVLGQTMLFHRTLARHTFAALDASPPRPIEDDIVFSLACGRRHFAVNVEPIVDLGADDANALWRRADHFARRQQAVDFMLAWRSRASSESDASA